MDNNILLKEVQKTELEILKEFIKVCDKLDINYYLIGGTLLGAVRHHGFIPWDDDIDVCMLRKDYEIFLKEAQKYLSKNLFLQTYKTDNGYCGCFAKIRNSETTFLEESVKSVDMNHGIFIDIFPLDNYYKYNKIKEKLILYKLRNNQFKKNKNIMKRLISIIAKIIYFNYSKNKLCELQEKIYTKNNKKDTEYITNYCGAWGVVKETHNIKNFKKFEIVNFENIKVKIPVGYNEILTNMYGDYMKLPPKEKQVTHHETDVIDCKRSYTNYTNFKRGDKN